MTDKVVRHLGRVPGWTMIEPEEMLSFRQTVLHRLKVEMKDALKLAKTHKDPKWRSRFLERHFVYVDAYIAVKEQKSNG